MPYELRYGNAPDDADPIIITDDWHEVKSAAVSFVRDFNTDLTGDQVLLISSFFYNDDNWARDPFGRMWFCEAGSRDVVVSEDTLGVTEMNFIVRQT